jgi:hypothetical protein
MEPRAETEERFTGATGEGGGGASLAAELSRWSGLSISRTAEEADGSLRSRQAT